MADQQFLDYEGLAAFKELLNGVEIVTATGDGTAYTATIPNLTTLKKGLVITIIPNKTSAATIPSLNVNGLGAKNIKQRLSTNTSLTAEAAADSWMVANKPVPLMFDGTQWVTITGRPSATALHGVVPIKSGGTGGETVEEARQNLGIVDVPAVSSADAGKIMLVSEAGKWTAAEAPEAGVQANFAVIGSTTAPSNPAENTIWVNTDVAVTSGVLSRTKPANPTEGMVWIETGDSSVLSFEALKSEGCLFDTVCPLFAKQYASGAWAEVSFMVYLNGEWNEKTPYYYHPTLRYNGQWKSAAYVNSGSASTPLTHNIKHNTDNMQATSVGSGTGLIYNDEQVDFSDLSMLTATISINHPDNVIVELLVIDKIATGYTQIATIEIPRTGNEETVTIPLSGVNSKGYIAVKFYANSADRSISIKNVKAE